MQGKKPKSYHSMSGRKQTSKDIVFNLTYAWQNVPPKTITSKVVAFTSIKIEGESLHNTHSTWL
jgi:hypothetical protein